MINTAQNKRVSELLSVDSHWRFKVPRYQREYIWRRENWTSLFDDLYENPSGYFLGSMICINRTDDPMQDQELELVDGQQRLTTLSLLYAAIYKCLAACEADDEDIKHDQFNLRYRLVFKSPFKSLILRLEPSHQGHNYFDYCSVLQDAGIIKGVETIPNAGNRRLFKAYRFFIDRLDELDDKGHKVFDSERIQDFLNRVNSASLVNIVVGSHADAFTLFESLNNRGEPLSALDIIKNNLLAALEKISPQSIDENFTKWKKLLENLSEDYTEQERFLRQYYNAFKEHKNIEVSKAPIATRSNIIRIYDEIIHRDAEWFFDDLFAKAQLYSKLITPLNDGVSAKMAKELLNLRRIGGTPANIMLLYALAERPEANICSMCDFLVRYFVRRNLTDVPPTRDLARIFIEIVSVLRKKSNCDPGIIIRQELLAKGRVATDEVFRDKLSGNIYGDNVDATRFILCRIEEEKQTVEKLTDLWERDERGGFIWTIEHIFPQGDNIPQCWVDMIAAGDGVLAREYRDKFTHLLGNLTITGYNSKLGNKSFMEKRDRKDSNGRNIGYNNGLSLNQLLQNANSWTVDDIKTRTESLVNTAMELFKLEYS
ncbi:MAG: DUF262 domain-containing protein [Pirellulales bacterium]|nr:DUF262 domain-containing protein [Pirellulales bacterium]